MEVTGFTWVRSSRHLTTALQNSGYFCSFFAADLKHTSSSSPAGSSNFLHTEACTAFDRCIHRDVTIYASRHLRSDGRWRKWADHEAT